MFNEEMTKKMMDLFANPLFKKGFFDFFLKTQQEGIEAARKFWDMNPEKDTFTQNTTEIFEQMTAFYSNLGFIPKTKYDEAVKENEALKKENEFLKNTVKEMNQKVFSEGSLQIQKVWKETIDKQMEIAKEMSKNFLELFKHEGKT